MYTSRCIYIKIISMFASSSRSAEKSLVLVHSIFRHGSRTPDKSHIYPKDPYANFDYQNLGYGLLTKVGIKESFQLGLYLRNRYQKFLGDYYYPGIVDPWSSNYDRTKSVLMAVLAAMFPPKRDQIWNDQLIWQPIPFNYVEGKAERMFLSIVNCSKANEAYLQYRESNEAEAILHEHKELILFLGENTGWDLFTTRHALMLAGTLSTEEGMGLTLPKWTQNVWPEEIENLAVLDYVFATANTTMKAHSTGLLLQKIVDDTKAKIEGKSKSKMHIYSGHDITVALVMRCLNIFYNHVPKFCALLVLELHKIDGVYGFKIFYRENGSGELKPYTIPNCPTFCPFDQFIAAVQDVLDENQRLHSSS